MSYEVPISKIPKHIRGRSSAAAFHKVVSRWCLTNGIKYRVIKDDPKKLVPYPSLSGTIFKVDYAVTKVSFESEEDFIMLVMRWF